MPAEDLHGRLPLGGVRVLDLTDGAGAMSGRLLADLGADVVLVEPPGGATARSAPPLVDGVSLPFLTQSANKRSMQIDWSTPAGREEVLALARAADILLESQTPGRLAAAGLGREVLHAANPRLVITSVTDFGQTGPYRDWVGTDWVHLALSSVLSRSGNPGRPPLMPPGRLAAEHGAAQAAWATLVAYWWALETGQGAAIMTNGDQGAALIAEIKFAIAAEYGWPGYTPRMVKVIPVDSTALAALTGDYQLDYRGQTLPLSIKLQNGKLIASTPVLGDDEELLPTSATKFVSSVRGMEFAFSGNVLTVTADGAFVLKGPRRE